VARVTQTLFSLLITHVSVGNVIRFLPAPSPSRDGPDRATFRLFFFPFRFCRPTNAPALLQPLLLFLRRLFPADRSLCCLVRCTCFFFHRKTSFTRYASPLFFLVVFLLFLLLLLWSKNRLALVFFPCGALAPVFFFGGRDIFKAS